MLSFLSLTASILLLLSYIVIFTFIGLFFIKSLIVRIISLGLGILGIGYVLIIFLNILGNPRPIDLDLFNNQLHYLISVKFDKNNAIYLWAIPENEKEPVYFVLPWNESTATKLVELRKTALTGGNAIGFGAGVNGGVAGGDSFRIISNDNEKSD